MASVTFIALRYDANTMVSRTLISFDSLGYFASLARTCGKIWMMYAGRPKVPPASIVGILPRRSLAASDPMLGRGDPGGRQALRASAIVFVVDLRFVLVNFMIAKRSSRTVRKSRYKGNSHCEPGGGDLGSAHGLFGQTRLSLGTGSSSDSASDSPDHFSEGHI
jgi:hypothetical protein